MIFALPLFGIMIYFSRRRMQPSAQLGEKSSKRLPVLLLRQFSDGGRVVERKAGPAHFLFLGFKMKIRLAAEGVLVAPSTAEKAAAD